MSNDYVFLSRWRVEGSCGEIADVLRDPLALAAWWPAVYLKVDELQRPDAHGRGGRVRLHTRGWLPYTLTWNSEVVDSQYPYGFTLVASGDFEGCGVWTFRQEGPFVDITYDWRVRAEKPLLKQFSFLLKPLFAANHRWAMAQGEESLKLELARRRASSDAGRADVPPPPGPVTYAAVGLIGAGLAAGAVLVYVLRRATRSASN